MALGDLDLSSNVLLVKGIKTGYGTPGTYNAQTTASGSTLTLNRVGHLGKTILLDTATGSVVTLPTSTGSGDVYQFTISTKVTSNNHIIKVGNVTDTMLGFVLVIGAGTTLGSDVAGGTDDTITLNGTTTGGDVGGVITVTDLVSGKWYVAGTLTGSSTLATAQFSATV